MHSVELPLVSERALSNRQLLEAREDGQHVYKSRDPNQIYASKLHERALRLDWIRAARLSKQDEEKSLTEMNAASSSVGHQYLSEIIPDSILQTLHQFSYAEVSLLVDITKNIQSTVKFLHESKTNSPPSFQQWLHLAPVQLPLPLPSPFTENQRQLDARYQLGSRIKNWRSAASYLRNKQRTLSTLLERDRQFFEKEAMILRRMGWAFQTRANELVVSYGLSHQVDAFAVVRRDIALTSNEHGVVETLVKIKLAFPSEHATPKRLCVRMIQAPSLKELFEQGSVEVENNHSSHDIKENCETLNTDHLHSSGSKVEGDEYALHRQLVSAQRTLFEMQVFDEIRIELLRDAHLYKNVDIKGSVVRFTLNEKLSIEIALVEDRPDSEEPSALHHWAVYALRKRYLMKRQYFERKLSNMFFPVDFAVKVNEKEPYFEMLRPIQSEMLFWALAENVQQTVQASLSTAFYALSFKTCVNFSRPHVGELPAMNFTLQSDHLSIDIVVEKEILCKTPKGTVVCQSSDDILALIEQTVCDYVSQKSLGYQLLGQDHVLLVQLAQNPLIQLKLSGELCVSSSSDSASTLLPAAHPLYRLLPMLRGSKVSSQEWKFDLHSNPSVTLFTIMASLGL